MYGVIRIRDQAQRCDFSFGSQDLKSLKELFQETVQSSGEALIILDSLDQLTDRGAGLRDWIPREIPDDVTMVLSAIPGTQFQVGQTRIQDFGFMIEMS